MSYRTLGMFTLLTLFSDPWTVAADRPTTPVYNLTLRTDSTPDLTDLPSYLQSVTSQWKTPQEQAIALWRWSQKLRKQTSNPKENDQDVFDPIQFFNSYGYCNCGVVSGLNDTMWLNMGWKARYVQLGDHTVCEASWDAGKSWHMFDASMSIYCFNQSGSVASVTEIEKNPMFYLQNFAPECGTNPVSGPNDHNGWRLGTESPVGYARSLANGVDSYKAPNGLQEGNLHSQSGQRYVLNLRADESYTRYFKRLDEGASDLKYFRPVQKNREPESLHNHQGLRANGVWHYAPNLRATGAADQVYDAQGVTWNSPEKGFAVRAKDAKTPGVIVFRVSAANVATSGTFKLTSTRQANGDAVTVEVSNTAGITYAPAWTMDKTGTSEAEIDLTSFVAGATEFLIRVKLTGAGAGLEAATIDTITQLNRAALPRLVRGSNRIQLVAGEQAETIQFQPNVIGGAHKATVFEEKSVDVERETGYYKPTLRPGENAVPCHATWKIETPTPIVGLTYGATACVKNPRDRVSLLHSWDGKSYTSDFEKKNDAPPFDLMTNQTVGGVPPNTRAALVRYEFETPRSANSYTGPGIQYAAMMVKHQPRITGFTPVELTYFWIEHRESGDVERTYTEVAESPAHEFTINVGGFRDPTMKWVRLNLIGSGLPKGESHRGYSDGQDVGPGVARLHERYTWGKNLAQEKLYKLSGRQSERNPDAGGDLTDGIIAPPEEHVSVKYMPTNVIFEKDQTAVAVIDLGTAQEMGAVRIHAAQEPGFHLAYPKSIVVETSVDGTNFAPVGQAEHNQVFDPPADFVPWEHDNSPKYKDLPAGGRLAYAYRVILKQPVSARYVRITCASQPGWGLLLSELQVFDKVTIDRDVPAAVVLPKLANRPVK